MRFQIFFVIGLACLLCACSHQNKPDKVKTTVNFKEGLKQVPVINLPFYWDQETIMNTKPLPAELDSLLKIGSSVVGYFRYEKVYGFITPVPADEIIPRLTVFDENGKKLSSELITIGKCHGDCSFECMEACRINKDFTLYAVFRSIHQECDGSGKIEAPHAEGDQIEQFGKIDKDGSITFDKQKKIEFKPDSMQLLTLGANTESFTLENDLYTQNINIKYTSSDQRNINFLIGHSSKETGCEYKLHGEAELVQIAKGNMVYQPIDNPSEKLFIHIAQTKSTAKITGSESKEECAFMLNELMKNKIRP